MITRRQFLKLAVGGTMLALTTQVGGKKQVVYAAIEGGTLDPGTVTKFVTPLLIPPAMPRAGTIRAAGGQNVDYYEISMRQFKQRILPAPLPETTVWGYGPVAVADKRALQIHNAPSLTIEARAGRPVRVKWINALVGPDGKALPHLLPVDPTLHWANPPGGAMGRDMRPTFEQTPVAYTGPVPIVTHVHGAESVGDESDGYAEAWFLPPDSTIPLEYAEYAKVGSRYDWFAGKAALKGYLAPGAKSWESGSSVSQYPNTQRASTIWYHDHALGMTRLNVYAGPAGFYIVRGGAGDVVLDTRTKLPAVLPGPAPKEGDRFPANKTYYEIPLAIQDRSFNADGSLFYPNTREFFDKIAGPYIPDTDVSPIWNPEFFGNCMMVNGRTWPSHTVEQRRYRFRLLNGCNSRFLILDFNAIPGVEVWQIGGDGGFLAAPVNMTASNGNRILLGPAERADVIVDFTNVPAGAYVLGNVGPDEPFGGGVPGDAFNVADPDSTGQVMQFVVVPALSADTSTPPQFLQLPAIVRLAGGTPRQLALIEKMSMDFDGPAEALLGRVDADGNPIVGVGMQNEPMPHPGDMWMDPITETPTVGSTEVWEFHNFTADAHPMHIHEVFFQVVDRQALEVDGDGVALQPAVLVGDPLPPEPWEDGWKDTVIAYPGQVTRVRMQFPNTPGLFVWHCHIVEHEDNEMMRPYRIIEVPAVAGTGVDRQFTISASGDNPFLCEVREA